MSEGNFWLLNDDKFKIMLHLTYVVGTEYAIDN